MQSVEQAESQSDADRRHAECATKVTQHFADEFVEFVFVKLRQV